MIKLTLSLTLDDRLVTELDSRDDREDDWNDDWEDNWEADADDVDEVDSDKVNCCAEAAAAVSTTQSDKLTEVFYIQRDM